MMAESLSARLMLACSQIDAARHSSGDISASKEVGNNHARHFACIARIADI